MSQPVVVNSPFHQIHEAAEPNPAVCSAKADRAHISHSAIFGLILAAGRLYRPLTTATRSGCVPAFDPDALLDARHPAGEAQDWSGPLLTGPTHFRVVRSIDDLSSAMRGNP